MAKHDIEVTIDAKGEVEFHAKGMKGKGCLSILKEFEKALGKQVAEPTPTAEMTETVSQSPTVKR